MESRSQRPPRLCERPPRGGTAPVEKKPCHLVTETSLNDLLLKTTTAAKTNTATLGLKLVQPIAMLNTRPRVLSFKTHLQPDMRQPS